MRNEDPEGVKLSSVITPHSGQETANGVTHCGEQETLRIRFCPPQSWLIEIIWWETEQIYELNDSYKNSEQATLCFYF